MGRKAAKPPWQVRIRAARGGTVTGGGILCANGTVLTCAHVVRQCAGADGRGGVLADFPFLERGSAIPARLVLAREGAEAGARDDIAVLRPERVPHGAEPAPFAERPAPVGHTLGAYGFPDGHPDGVWSGGRLAGHTAGGLLQFAATGPEGHPPARGFSGSPVWDEDLQAVIGMVTAVDRRPALRTAYAVPVDELRRYWPELADPYPVRLWVHDPHGGPPRMIPLPTRGPGRHEFWVGRGDGTPAEPDILLASRPPHVVSRWHCRLACEFGHWYVESPVPQVTTFVRHRGDDGLRQVPEEGQLRLHHGDRVAIRAVLSAVAAAPDRAADAAPRRTLGYWELEFVDDRHTMR
ncbi:trypsin-like peptidase domain-containing protein [Streptomyces sp. NPDC101393]|uniref:trypsin-like peptidase domain-containing protein n=1 Tax=Streptomyces sp. NPDC101393 TaxID=3366141 RepID=UPI003814AA05